MLDSLLQPSAVTRLLHLLQAAQPFLTPSWNRLADMCIRLLNISELLFNPRKTDLSRLLHDVRGCTPANDMNALLCAIRPFCSDEELQIIQMYEQFQQMQKAMEMWKMFSNLMPDATESASPFDNLSSLFGASNGNNFDNMFSAFMNAKPVAQEANDTSKAEYAAARSPSESSSETEADSNPLLAFLSPEQLSLYNNILKGDSYES